MSIKNWLTEMINSIGLYTSSQYLHQVEVKGLTQAYAAEGEKAVIGMSDPTRPIVVFSDYTNIQDVRLQHGQQIIVSPLARFISINGIFCEPKI